MSLKWFKIQKKQPKSTSGHNIDVIVEIEGLTQTASDYEEYRVVQWQPNLKCFIEWCGGKVIKYNDTDNPYKAWVTHWAYFNRVKETDF